MRDLRSNAQALELGNETCAPLDQVDAYFAFEDTNAILSDVNFVAGTNSGVTLGGTGKHGYGADFDGSASFSMPPIVPSWVFEAGGGLSLGFFVRVDTLPTTTASLVEARLGDSTERGWSLELTSTGRLRWTSTYDAASDDAFVLETTQGLPTGMVFHVAFTMDTTSSAAHFWVNGESIAFTETPGTGATGSFPGNNNPHPGSIDLVVGAGYDGILDELLIASYALSPVEVANLVDGSTSTNVLACGACGARCGTGSVCESGECVVRACGTSFRHAWSFDEGTGAVAGNSAWREAWVGIAEWTSVSAPSTPGDGPPAGSAAHFADDTAGALFSDPTGTHDGNIAAWVRPNAAASGPRVIVGNMDGDVGWELRLTTGHGLAFEVRVDGSNKLLVEGPASDVPVSTWSHVAVTYDGTGTAAGVRLFVDGVQLTTTDVVVGTPTGHLSFDDVRLGGTAAGVGFDGDIDELLVMDPAVGSGGIAHLAVAEQHACVPSAALDCDDGGATVASCDGRSFSGCESDLSNDDYNCGTCGRVCSTCVDSVCTSVVEVCDNSTDDDSDGLVDCEDSACFTSPLCIDWEAHCDDGRDNDGNGFTDCDDVQCQGIGDCPSASETNCLDGFDDDGDGALDCLDSDCKNAFGCPVDPNPEVCELRGDENGNGLADCADPACSSYWICESGAETECGDYVDNDGDGFTDCADADCSTATHCTGGNESCANYQDDDGDGAIDCGDADCASDPACDNSSATATSGEPCTGASSCLVAGQGAPACIPESFGGVPGGHCTEWCNLDATSGCPSGQQCVVLNPDWEQRGVCVDRCLDGAECAAYTDDRQCRRLGVGDEAYLVCRRQCDVNGDCTSTGLCDPDFETCRSPFEICDDGVDNDGNGDDDCDDEACWGTTHCHYPDESAFCQDGYDNDDDGDTDCADSDCDYAWSCTGAHYETWCGDGVDNDGDGYTDCADDECDTDPLCPGCGSTVDCGDPGCVTHPACDVTEESACYVGDCCTNSDGSGAIDDDGDGLANCADPDCMGLDPACPWQEWSCTDGIDNDGDQLMDCLDSECASDPACVSGSGAMLAWCDSHNECDGGDGVPYCMPLGAGSGLDGQCLHSCDLSDSSTCETGFDCVDLGLPGDVGMCMPGCMDASDCVGTEQCEPLQEFSFGVCVPGCTTDADCPWGGICDTNSGACGPPPPATEDDCWWANDCCADGIDHDLDGDVDCEDSDCAGVGECPAEICWNGTDDDSDGAPDCFDSDCYDRGYCDGTDDGELAVGEACTRTDQCTGEFGTPFCSDLGVFVDGYCVAYCDSEASPSEQCGGNADLQCVPIMAGEDPPHMCVPVEDCTDTVDNDLDGDTDCADDQCTAHGLCTAVCGDGWHHANEACDDGTGGETWCDDSTCTLNGECEDLLDGDSDGLVDCQDPDCADAPECEVGTAEPGEACETHSDCATENGFMPYCLPPAEGTDPAEVDGTCVATCSLERVWTCGAGRSCVALDAGQDIGLCVPDCEDDSDCHGTERCHSPTGLGSVCVAGCTVDTDCTGTDVCNPADGQCVTAAEGPDVQSSDWFTVPFIDVPTIAVRRFDYEAAPTGLHVPVPLTYAEELQLPPTVDFRTWTAALGADAQGITVEVSAPRTSCGVTVCDQNGLPAGCVPGDVECVDIDVVNATGIDLGDLYVELHAPEAAASTLYEHFLPPVAGQADPSDISGEDFVRPSGNPVWVVEMNADGNDWSGTTTVVFPDTGVPDILDVYVRMKPEICENDVDDDGDGRVDEECRTELDDDACVSDFDCFMGTCGGDDLCDQVTDFAQWFTIAEYDIDLSDPSQSLNPIAVAQWESDDMFQSQAAVYATLEVEIGYTPEECGQPSDVYPWDEEGMTCIRAWLDAPNASDTDASVWLEILDDTVPLYEGTSASTPFPVIPAYDGGQAPVDGFTRRMGPILQEASTLEPQFELPEVDQQSAGTVRVRTAILLQQGPPEYSVMSNTLDGFAEPMWPFPHFWGIFVNLPWEEPTLQIPDPLPYLYGPAFDMCESPYLSEVSPAIYDVAREFGVILDEIGWTSAYLANEFVAQNSSPHLSSTARDSSPMEYMLKAFGAQALDCAFPTPPVGETSSLSALADSCTEQACAAKDWLANPPDEDGWAVLLNIVAPSTSRHATYCDGLASGWDSYWGFRALAEHTGLGHHARMPIPASYFGLDPEWFVIEIEHGSVPTDRSYILPARTMRVRQFSSDVALPYHGPLPSYGRLLGEVSATDPSPMDSDPAARVGWPEISFFGGSGWTLNGCGATVEFDASTPYLQDAWTTEFSSQGLPMRLSGSKSGEGADRVAFAPVLQPQTFEFASADRFTVNDLRLSYGLRDAQGELVAFGDAIQLPEMRDPSAMPGVGYDPWADGPLAQGDWLAPGGSFLSPSEKSPVQNLLDARLNIEASPGFRVQLGDGPSVHWSNVRRIRVTRLVVDGAFSNGWFGSSQHGAIPVPTGSTSLMRIKPLTDGQSRPGYVGSSYPSETLDFRQSLCAAECMSTELHVEHSHFTDSAGTNLYPNYVRRVIFDDIRVHGAGRGGLNPTIAPAGADVESNNTRGLPRVEVNSDGVRITSDALSGRPAGSAQCERMRPGEVVFVDSVISGQSSPAVALGSGHFGQLDGAMFVDCTLDQLAPSEKVVFYGGGSRIDVVDSDLRTEHVEDAEAARLAIWGSGSDGIFVNNTVSVDGNVLMGGPTARRDTYTVSDDSKLASVRLTTEPVPSGGSYLAEYQLLGGKLRDGTFLYLEDGDEALIVQSSHAGLRFDELPEGVGVDSILYERFEAADSLRTECTSEDAGPVSDVPYATCLDHLLDKVSAYGRIVTGTETQLTVVQPHDLPERYHISYDAAWPPVVEPIRAFHENTVTVEIWAERHICHGGSFYAPVDSFVNNDLRFVYRPDWSGGVPFDESPCAGAFDGGNCAARLYAPIARGTVLDASGNVTSTCILQKFPGDEDHVRPILVPLATPDTGVCTPHTRLSEPDSSTCLTPDCKLGGEPYCWTTESFEDWGWRRIAPDDGAAAWDIVRSDYDELSAQVDARVARARAFLTEPTLELFSDPEHRLAVNERFEAYFDDDPASGGLCVESDPQGAADPEVME